MSRGVDERVADVRRLVDAGRTVYERRALLAEAIARSTGLSREGVELGFQSLERDAPDADVRSLVAATPTAEHVHVILAANVFVAPLRALAIARAAASRVTIRPSPRDPVLSRALVAASDGAVALTEERDVARIEADEIHVYGTSATVDAVRARARRGVAVRGHAAGMGVAWVTPSADLATAAERLAGDVVAFDQRGCLSPRVAIVEGDETRAERLARALSDCLDAASGRVPRGVLFDDERADAARWRDAMTFAGRIWSGAQHVVALAGEGASTVVPPPGRHVHVVSERSADGAAARLATLAAFVVAVGTDDPRAIADKVPTHARLSALGRMQRPAFDGPVDRRTA